MIEKESVLKTKAVDGVIWSAIEKFFTKFITLFFGILIARVLLPEDYGIVAMLNIFMAISQSFIDSGFAAACVRKLDRTAVDLNTVFFFNTVTALFFYAALWVLSPVIADFYSTPILVKVCRISSLSLVIGALRGVHSVILSIKVDFKSFAVASIISSVLSGIVGLIMAFNGYGVWTLVYQQLLASFLWTLILWIRVKWHPSLMFSWHSFSEMFTFGSRLLVSGLLDSIYNNIYPLVIGKAFTSKQLGEYSKAGSFSDFTSLTVSSVFAPVFYPVFSTLQNEKEKLIRYYLKSVSLIVYIVFPMCFGLSAVSRPLTNVLLTEKWCGIIPILQILCFATMLFPVHAISMNIIKVIGRSDVLLRVETVNKIIGLATLFVSLPFGIIGVCAGRAVASLSTYFIDAVILNRVCHIGVYEQLSCLKHALILSILMYLIVGAVVCLVHSQLSALLLGSLIGAGCYFLLSVVFRIDELRELYSILKQKITH